MKCGDVRASTGEQAAAGRATRRMIGALGAEFERIMISERTRARVKFGWKPKVYTERIKHARKLAGEGAPSQHVAGPFGVGRVILDCAFAGASA